MSSKKSHEKPISFMGFDFSSKEEFMAAFPAYKSDTCIKAINAGCNTPFEVEQWFYERSPEVRRKMIEAARRSAHAANKVLSPRARAVA